MTYQVLARKWRPRVLKEVVGQEPTLRVITNALIQQRLHQAYLFSGTHGVGKTTLARILAKCLNCESGITAEPCGTCQHCTAIDAGRFLDLIEIDAASRTKVEDTREILDNILYQPTQGRYKVYLIDEVHMLSTHSFNALLKTLEEPPSYVIFLLATTDPKRLPVTVLSRCLQLHLKRIPVEQIKQQLEHICQAETIKYEVDALQQLAQAANGSLRDALSLLDQANAFCHSNITTTDIRQMLGSIEVDTLLRLLEALAEKSGMQLITEINQLAEFATDFNQILEEILTLLHRMTLLQIVGDTPQEDVRIVQLAKRFKAEDIQLYYQIALIGRRDLPLAPTPQLGFEMIMLRMLAFTPVTESQPAKQALRPESAPNTDAPLQKAQPAAEPAREWADTIAKLGLTGMAQALAANCSLIKLTQDQVILSLSVQHEPMFNKKLQARIEEALIQHFNRPIKLDIQLTSTEIHTPSKLQQQEQAARHSVATESIRNDGEVQKMMDIFGATLDMDSIQTVSVK